MANLVPGMWVKHGDQVIGTVESIEYTGTGSPARVHVAQTDGTALVVAADTIRVEGDTVQLTMQAAYATQGADAYTTQKLSAGQADAATSDQVLRIPVIREEAVVRTRQIERGGVRVHKTVNEREEQVEQPIHQEQVEVERIAIGQVIQSMPEVREEGDTLIIPVVEEMLVVEKRLVLKEEVRITRRRTETSEQVRVTLREEQVTIEQIDEGADQQAMP